jgi:hypothetical protein
MSTKSKLIIGGIIVLVLLVFAYIIKIQHDIITNQRNIETKIIEFKQLGDGLARLESKITTDRADLEKKLNDLGVDYKKIEEDLKNNDAKLEIIAVTIGATEGYKKTNIGSDWQQPIPTNNSSVTNSDAINPNASVLRLSSSAEECVNKYGYCNNIQGLNLFELGPADEKIPFGDVAFNATSPTPWSLNVYPRKYYSVLSVGKNTEGNIVAHSQVMIEDNNGNKHKIGISEKSYVEQVNKTYRFYWWSPRFMGEYSLGLRTDGAVSSIVGLKAYISSYTANKSRPTWMFIGLGGGYDMSNRRPAVSVSPVAYNVFHTTELIQNLYVAPTVSMATDGGVGIHGTIGLIF